MCGIAAISLSPRSHLPLKQLTHLLLLNMENRGRDASGYAFYTRDEVKYFKKGTPGGKLDVSPIPRGTRSIIIHTRNGTKGNASYEQNNHPVLSPKSKIAVVHNGVINNDTAVRADFDRLPEVDTAVIPAMIERHGWRDMARQLSGWMALAWLDTEDNNTIHLLRRDRSSPMATVLMQDGSFIMASTFSAIYAALDALGLGSKVKSTYDVPELTYMTVRRGRVVAMENSPDYSHKDSRYKTAYMTPAERQRLEATTSGRTHSSTPPPKGGGVVAPKALTSPRLPAWDQPTPNGGTCDIPQTTVKPTPHGGRVEIIGDDPTYRARWFLLRRTPNGESLRYYNLNEYMTAKRNTAPADLIDRGFVDASDNVEVLVSTLTAPDQFTEVGQFIDYHKGLERIR